MSPCHLLDAAGMLQREGWDDRILFRLIGDGPEKPRLMERAAAEGLRNVQFDDPVSKERIYSVLQEADVFAVVAKDIPLYRWGISFNKIFDYLASARPTVFSGDVSYDPIAEVKAGLSVPAEDPRSIADAVKSLALMRPEERWEMGLRGRRYVEENHDLRRLMDRFETALTGINASWDDAVASI